MQRIDWAYLDAHLVEGAPLADCGSDLGKKHNQQVYLALLSEEPPSPTPHTSLSEICGVWCDSSLWVTKGQSA